MFPHMKLLAQLLYPFFFFIAFFSNSVRLLLDFPSINPVRLPQKNFMFSHMFLWVFFFLDVLMLNVSCEMGFIFIFFGSTDTGCFLRIVILVFIYFLCWLFLWEDCDFSFFFSVKMFGVVFLLKTQNFSNFPMWDAWVLDAWKRVFSSLCSFFSFPIRLTHLW